MSQAVVACSLVGALLCRQPAMQSVDRRRSVNAARCILCMSFSLLHRSKVPRAFAAVWPAVLGRVHGDRICEDVAHYPQYRKMIMWDNTNRPRDKSWATWRLRLQASRRSQSRRLREGWTPETTQTASSFICISPVNAGSKDSACKLMQEVAAGAMIDAEDGDV